MKIHVEKQRLPVCEINLARAELMKHHAEVAKWLNLFRDVLKRMKQI